MRIQHNIMAMNAYRNYGNNTSALSKNLEKLSSGYRINRAGDDAAGLAISEKMRAQIQGLNAAQKNVKDAISFVKTAEGAMQEIQDMLSRMKYLATQSANGTYESTVDRAALQDEVDSLLEEINRIAQSANFNDIHMLAGKSSNGGGGIKPLTASPDDTNAAGVDMTIAFAEGASEEAKKALNEALAGKSITVTGTADQGGNIKEDDGVKITGLSSLLPSGYTVTFKTGDGSSKAFTDGDNIYFAAAGGKSSSWPDEGNDLVLTISDADGNAVATITLDGSKLKGNSGGTAASTVTFADASSSTSATNNKPTFEPDATNLAKFDIDSIDFSAALGLEDETGDGLDVQLSYSTSSVFTLTVGGKTYTGTLTTSDGSTGGTTLELFTANDADGTGADGKITLKFISTTTKVGTDQTGAIAAASVGKVTVPKAGGGDGEVDEETDFNEGLTPDPEDFEITMQIGDTSDGYNQMKMKIQSMTTDSLGLTVGESIKLSIANVPSANSAIGYIKDAINTVSSVRGNLGAYQNRLEHTANNLSVMTENIQDAESTIRDTDVAEEMMAYTKNNILIQSAQAMLAQANAVPQGVLQLLG